MNRISIPVLATALLCGSLLAQAQQSPSTDSKSSPEQTSTTPQSNSVSTPAAPTATANDSNSKIAAGSVIPVQLTKSVDAKKAKTGDEVVAKVTQDLRNNAGTILVAKDTKVIGHVTEAQARNKEQKESQVAIAFDHMVPKNGEPMQMPMSIQAIIAPQNSNSANAGSQGAQPASGYPGSEPGSSPGARPGAMGGSAGGTTPQAQNIPQSTGGVPTEASGGQSQVPINGNTRGVVGIANLNLSAASDAAQGSVVSSEKNNVKLDDGTFLLLRVNQ